MIPYRRINQLSDEISRLTKRVDDMEKAIVWALNKDKQEPAFLQAARKEAKKINDALQEIHRQIVEIHMKDSMR